MKKLPHEAQLVKEAIKFGGNYAKARGVGEIEESDGLKEKVEFVYRLLVHDNLIQPLQAGKDDLASKKHRLALWMSKKLPDDHVLNRG